MIPPAVSRWMIGSRSKEWKMFLPLEIAAITNKKRWELMPRITESLSAGTYRERLKILRPNHTFHVSRPKDSINLRSFNFSNFRIYRNDCNCRKQSRFWNCERIPAARMALPQAQRKESFSWKVLEWHGAKDVIISETFEMLLNIYLPNKRYSTVSTVQTVQDYLTYENPNLVERLRERKQNLPCLKFWALSLPLKFCKIL